jgi:hypothetical protein
MTDVAAPDEREPEIREDPQPRLRDLLLQKAQVISKDLPSGAAPESNGPSVGYHAAARSNV